MILLLSVDTLEPVLYKTRAPIAFNKMVAKTASAKVIPCSHIIYKVPSGGYCASCILIEFSAVQLRDFSSY
jgi:hypothetical protein